MRAVVLLSGGMDSSTVLAIAKEQYDVWALTILYGQTHSKEVQSAKKIAKQFKVTEHRIIKLPKLLGSSLTGFGDIPQQEMSGIPTTYVPARNLIFLSLAANYAESINSKDIFIGVNAVDFSGYPDCRPSFIREFQDALNEGTEGGFTIHAPIISLTKTEIIKKGLELGVDYSMTRSCYSGGKKACGKCPSCRIRLRAFKDLGIPDLIKYKETKSA